MTSSIHIDMHREHKTWETEFSQWRDDVAQWQKQLAAILPALDTVKKKLDEHAERLRKHAGSMRMQEQDVGAHEHQIVEFEMGAKGEELPGLAAKHKLEARRQAERREAHAKLKQLHHAIMIQAQRLVGTLGVEAHPEPSKLIPGEGAAK